MKKNRSTRICHNSDDDDDNGFGAFMVIRTIGKTMFFLAPSPFLLFYFFRYCIFIPFKQSDIYTLAHILRQHSCDYYVRIYYIIIYRHGKTYGGQCITER